MKECKILGYGTYTDKETHEEKLRVVLGVESLKDNYYGIQPAVAFLEKDDILIMELSNYIKNPSSYQAYYETTDNIVTGKTKVSKIIIK